MNNNCLIRQGYHNSGEPITVVPELKRYARNRFSGIAGALDSNYFLRDSRSTCTWWIWIGWSEGCMNVERHLLACSRFWWFCWKTDLWKKTALHWHCAVSFTVIQNLLYRSICILSSSHLTIIPRARVGYEMVNLKYEIRVKKTEKIGAKSKKTLCRC